MSRKGRKERKDRILEEQNAKNGVTLEVRIIKSLSFSLCGLCVLCASPSSDFKDLFHLCSANTAFSAKGATQ